MKNFTLTLLLIAQTGMLVAQIPNPGFEFWGSATIGTLTVNNPSGWGTQNFDNVFGSKPESATYTTTAYEGNRSLVLTNNAGTPAYVRTEQFAGGGFNLKFPLGFKYMNLELYYQYDSPGLDSFMVEVNLYKNGTKTGTGKMVSGEKKNTFTRLVVPLQYSQSVVPDSASINIVAGKTTPYTSGSVLTVDALNFIDLSTGVTEFKSASGDIKRIFPNPASSEIAIVLDENKVYDMVFSDITGKTIETITQVSLVKEWRWVLPEELKNGLYFIKVSEGENAEYHRLVINR